MKRNFLFLIAISFIIISLSSCEEDNISSSSVIGTWKCMEYSNIYSPNPYFVDIIRETYDTTLIRIDNFYNLGYGKEITAQLDGSNIIIQPQSVDGFSISGTGEISSNYKQIEWDYTVDDGSAIDIVNAIYTRN